jgi:hypothetical protein
MANGGRAGISVFDKSTTYLGVSQTPQGRVLVFAVAGVETTGPTLQTKVIQLRGRVTGDTATYSYSLDDGRTFHSFGQPVKLSFSWWKGARPALFSFNTAPVASSISDAGYADFDWVRYRALAVN